MQNRAMMIISLILAVLVFLVGYTLMNRIDETGEQDSSKPAEQENGEDQEKEQNGEKEEKDKQDEDEDEEVADEAEEEASPWDMEEIEIEGEMPVPVLMYHHFDSEPETNATITPEDFEQQMQFLDEHGFSSISMDDLLKLLEEEDDSHLPDRPVLITIDDGYASTYHKALPIMEEYGFDSYMFMITDRIGETVGEYDFLTEEQLLTLEETGHPVESHSVSHDPFTEQEEGESPEEWRQRIETELVESKQVLEDLLDRDVDYFAYPFGAWDSETEQMVVDAGYEATFLARPGYVDEQSHPQRLFRFGITKNTTMEEFGEIFDPWLDEEENGS